MARFNCSVCGVSVSDDLIFCNGFCPKFFHANHLDLTEEQLEDIWDESSDFYCDKCSQIEFVI